MPKGIPKSGLNKGWFKKGSHNSIKTEFKKGNVSWIKGKNKFNNDIVKGISEKLTGRIHSEIERKNISKGLKRIGWKSPKGMLGKKHTEDWKRERSKKSKGENNPFYGKKHTLNIKKIISLKNIERFKRSSHPMLGKKQNPESILKMIMSQKELWKDQEYKKRMLDAIYKNRHLLPNKPERILIEIIKNNNLPFEYVGDYNMWIDGFNPDFIDEKNKRIIELFGNYWHNLPRIVNRDIKRFEIYKNNGYKTLVIWDYELKNINLVKEKLINFARLDNLQSAVH